MRKWESWEEPNKQNKIYWENLLVTVKNIPQSQKWKGWRRLCKKRGGRELQNSETKVKLYQNDRKKNVWRKLRRAHGLKHTTSSLKLSRCMGMRSFQWHWVTAVYWWCDCRQKQLDEFLRGQSYFLCLNSARCSSVYSTVVHSTDGQQAKRWCESFPRSRN